MEVKMKTNQLQLLTAESFETMYSNDFSKKEAEQVGKDLCKKVFSDGLLDEKKVFSNICRLKEVVNSADKAFRERLNIENTEIVNGVELSSKNSAKRLNYTDDPIYNELAEKLKQREELLKVAHASNDVLFDSDGIEVPKVSVSLSKASIVVKF